MIVSIRREFGQLITTGAQLLLLTSGMQLQTRNAWMACVALMSVASLIAWVFAQRRRRAIADTPTSRIASAAQGYVELSGYGKPLDYPPLLSQLRQFPAFGIATGSKKDRTTNGVPSTRVKVKSLLFLTTVAAAVWSIWKTLKS